MKCELCEETRGIQSCHIIPRICDCLLEHWIELNKLNRLYLCPNHHWYFDHNQLTDQEKAVIKPKIMDAMGRLFANVESLYKIDEDNKIKTFEEYVDMFRQLVYRNRTIKNDIIIMQKLEVKKDGDIKCLE